MATLATTQIVPGGVAAPTLAAAAAAGDKVVPGPKTFLIVSNSNASARTVTINDPNSAGPAGANQFDADVVKSVVQNATWYFGPLTAERWADPTTGLVHVTYSSEVGVTVAAVAV